MTLQRIDAFVQFTRANKAAYDAFPFNIPKNYLVYSIDTKELRLGDGEHTYAQLQNVLDLDDVFYAFKDIITTDMVDTPNSGNINKIIIVNALGHLTYGTLDITNLISFIANNPSIEDAQGETINGFVTIFNKILSNLQINDNGSLVLVNPGEDQFIPGNNLNDYISNTILEIYSNLAFNITDLKIYSDEACTTEITELNTDSTAYAKIYSLNSYNENISYDLVSDNSEITIAPTVITNIFILTLSSSADTTSPTTFTASGILNGVEKSIDKAININAPLPLVYINYLENSHNNEFYSIAADNYGNYIGIGYTDENYNAIIAKFDQDLNLLISKTYGGANDDRFRSVIIDGDDYIVIGYTGENNAALIIKFDQNLNIIFKKIYSGSSGDYFNSIAVYNGEINDYIAVGSTSSGGEGYNDALITKFDSDFNNALATKIYGGTGSDYFYSVAIDNSEIISYIAVGYTNSEGQGSNEALIVKFDQNLNKVAAKTYSGTGNDEFKSIAVDNINPGGPYYIAVGDTSSEGQGYDAALIVKFNSDLTIAAKKIYDGNSADEFNSVIVDIDGNYIAIGKTGSEGSGNSDALIVKFNNDLTIAAKKYCGQNAYDKLNSIAIDNDENYVAVGFTGETGDTAALIVKIFGLPLGSFISNDLNFQFIDSNLTLTNSNLTLADSNLTLADLNLTLNTATLSLSNISYTENKNVITE